MLLILVLYATFGASFSAAKKALLIGSPLSLSWARSAISALVLLPMYYFVYKDRFNFKIKHFGRLFIYGFVCAFSYVAANWSMLKISSIETALFYTLSPLITALIAYLFYNEKLCLRKWIGLLFGLCGIIIVTVSKADSSSSLALHWPELPELLLFMAVTAYASSWLIIKPLITKHHYKPVMINGLASLVSALLISIPILATNTIIPSSLEFWSWASMQAVLSTVICYSLYMYLLHHYTATFLSFCTFIEPIFAAIYGWLLLSEVPSSAFWVSTIFITIGLYIFYRVELKHITKD